MKKLKRFFFIFSVKLLRSKYSETFNNQTNIGEQQKKLNIKIKILIINLFWI